ncbi:MAG: hypothetical protein ABL895_02770 [Cyclobacteriaceae bacterium]
MKVNFSQLLAIIIIILTVSTVNSLFAQEGAPINETPELGPPTFSDPSTREEKPLLSEPEGKSTLQKDQTIIAPVPTKPKGKNSESAKASKTEEDALSFNFLYYIIQKFKISDIVDQ